MKPGAKDINNYTKKDVYAVRDFLKKFKIKKTPESIIWAMNENYIDWCQPARDRLVIVTPKTKKYFGIES